MNKKWIIAVALTQLLLSIGLNQIPVNAFKPKVAVGAIILFWGDRTNIPKEFKVCDGTAIDDRTSPIHGLIVPKLQNKFPQGANESSTDVSRNPQYGGSNKTPEIQTSSEAITEATMAAHSHAVRDQSHSHPNRRDAFFERGSTSGGGNQSILLGAGIKGPGGRPNGTTDGYYLMDFESVTNAQRSGISLQKSGGNSAGNTIGHLHRIRGGLNKEPEYQELFYIIRIK